MIRIHVALALLFSPLVLASGPTTLQKLGLMKWKKRVLLFHSPSADSKNHVTFKRQIKALKTDCDERHITIVKADAATLKSLSIPEDRFTLLLIGKDGTVKARQSGQIDLKALFTLIDTMPMRQREMQEK